MAITDTLSHFREGINRLYLVSYLWYPAIGAATTVVIALIVSSIKGDNNTGPHSNTGRARLIRSHSSARFSFELSGNLN